MCNAGGFKLTKFVSNSNDVMMALPESLRKNGIKNTELIAEEDTVERALGVQWNINE